MKENREEYEIKIRKEFIDTLKIEMEKEYQIDEIKELLNKHHLTGGLLKFVPTKVHTGKTIIDTLVYRDLRVTDAIHKELGIYEDKSKCEKCENYYDAEKDKMFQVEHENHSLFLCRKCRRGLHIKIKYYDFTRWITEEDREAFVLEESNYGIDYSDYMERLNRNKVNKT